MMDEAKVRVQVDDPVWGESFTVTVRESEARVGQKVYALFPGNDRRELTVVALLPQKGD